MKPVLPSWQLGSSSPDYGSTVGTSKAQIKGISEIKGTSEEIKETSEEIKETSEEIKKTSEEIKASPPESDNRLSDEVEESEAAHVQENEIMVHKKNMVGDEVHASEDQKVETTKTEANGDEQVII